STRTGWSCIAAVWLTLSKSGARIIFLVNSSRTGAADFTSEQGQGVASLPEVRVGGKRAQFREKLCADRRVLFFIYSLSSGGDERVTANLINYWAGRGWDVTLVTLAPIDLDFYELHARVRRVALNQ